MKRLNLLLITCVMVNYAFAQEPIEREGINVLPLETQNEILLNDNTQKQELIITLDLPEAEVVEIIEGNAQEVSSIADNESISESITDSAPNEKPAIEAPLCNCECSAELTQTDIPNINMLIVSVTNRNDYPIAITNQSFDISNDEVIQKLHAKSFAYPLLYTGTMLTIGSLVKNMFLNMSARISPAIVTRLMKFIINKPWLIYNVIAGVYIWRKFSVYNDSIIQQLQKNYFDMVIIDEQITQLFTFYVEKNRTIDTLAIRLFAQNGLDLISSTTVNVKTNDNLYNSTLKTMQSDINVIYNFALDDLCKIKNKIELYTPALVQLTLKKMHDGLAIAKENMPYVKSYLHDSFITLKDECTVASQYLKKQFPAFIRVLVSAATKMKETCIG